MTANSIAHEAFCAGQAWQQAAAAQERPCVLWKPRLFRDGNQWCALLGENIQDGAVGFGDSPDAAMLAFDEAWREKLPPAPDTQPAPSDEYVGWYCAHCERGVDASEVTYHEQHTVCGRVITDDKPPKPAPSIPEGWQDGVKAVANMLQKKADDYAVEHGHDDMGGLSFGGGISGKIKMNYYTNLIELIEEVEAMPTATPEAKPSHDQRRHHPNGERSRF